MAHNHDFTTLYAGSVVLVTPETPEACAWVEENVSEDRCSFGPSFAVEPGYVDDLLNGIAAAGLTFRRA